MKPSELFDEFKPSLIFLGRFVAIYFLCNLLYGAYVSAYKSRPDPITIHTTHQASRLISFAGWETTTEDNKLRPSTFVVHDGRRILSVYEGCNGVNVVIIFVAFVIAFGPLRIVTLWFLTGGIVLIYLVNLARIWFLFFVSLELPNYLYFTHKYLFTGMIFLVVFVLWILWVRLASAKR